VIFEEAGAGAITRVWMTMGSGTSIPLDPTIRIRFYLDGESAPRIDLPLPDFFSGAVAPFLAPLVGDRLVSSGGNFNYVPIPYRQGCKVTLQNAGNATLWFQFTFHRLSGPDAVSTFTGNEDLSGWVQLLSAAGTDPWPGSGPISSGTIQLQAGQTSVIYSRSGSNLLTGLWLQVPDAERATTTLTLQFDGHITVNMPVSDFFAFGRGSSTPTRSVLLGEAANGALYCYFPMPFFLNAEVRLTNSRTQGPPVTIQYQVRRSLNAPLFDNGLFGAWLHWETQTPVGVDYPLLALSGQGKWVGLFADLGSVSSLDRSYLEGDERIYLDTSLHPGSYGTGVEDFFGAGFYFDRGVFTLPLHGMTYHLLNQNFEDVTAAYRFLLTDAPTFAADLRAGMEVGPEGNLSMRARTVAYFYSRADPGLNLADVLDLGDPQSRSEHGYMVSGNYQILTLSGNFEGEPPLHLQADGIYRGSGIAEFHLNATACGDRLRLRRRFDASAAGQTGFIYVAGQLAAGIPFGDANPYRPWREIDLDLPLGTAAGSELTVSVLYPQGMPSTLFTEFQYQLWCNGRPLVTGAASGGASRVRLLRN